MGVIWGAESDGEVYFELQLMSNWLINTNYKLERAQSVIRAPVRRVSATLERGSSYASVWPKSHLTGCARALLDTACAFLHGVRF